jgi:hypothetical protein
VGVRQVIVDKYAKTVEHKYRKILVSYLNNVDTSLPRKANIARIWKNADVYSIHYSIAAVMRKAVDEEYDTIEAETTEGRDQDVR